MNKQTVYEDKPLESDAEERARLCRCGHTRGNHRWFAIGGKHQCYHYDNDVRCECPAFTPGDKS